MSGLVKFVDGPFSPRRWSSNRARVLELMDRPGVWAEIFSAPYPSGGLVKQLRLAAKRLGVEVETLTKGEVRNNGLKVFVLYARAVRTAASTED